MRRYSGAAIMRRLFCQLRRRFNSAIVGDDYRANPQPRCGLRGRDDKTRHGHYSGVVTVGYYMSRWVDGTSGGHLAEQRRRTTQYSGV